MARNTAFDFLVAGGVLTILLSLAVFGGILAASSLTNVPALQQIAAQITGVATAWGVVVGLILIGTAYGIKDRNSSQWIVAGLVFSILGLITLQGMLIRPILGLIGTAIAWAELKHHGK